MFTLNNNRNSKFEIVFVGVITLIAILTLGMIKFSPASVANRSYDAIERVRTARVLAPASKTLSYEGIETVRANRFWEAAASSYDAIESLRNARGVSADRSYDALEQVRASLSVSFPASVSSYDALEQLRLGRGMKDAYAQIEALRLAR